jgi:hypothetical protein
MGSRTRQSGRTSHSGAQHVAFGFGNNLGLCGVISFAAQYPTPHDRCVRFVAVVTGAHATLTTGGSLLPYPGRTFTGWTAPASPGAPQTDTKAGAARDPCFTVTGRSARAHFGRGRRPQARTTCLPRPLRSAPAVSGGPVLMVPGPGTRAGFHNIGHRHCETAGPTVNIPRQSRGL